MCEQISLLCLPLLSCIVIKLASDFIYCRSALFNSCQRFVASWLIFFPFFEKMKFVSPSLCPNEAQFPSCRSVCIPLSPWSITHRPLGPAWSLGLFLLNALLRLCVWSERRLAVISCFERLPLTTCVIKHCAERPIEWPATLLMFKTSNQTQRLIDSAMVHCLYNYPAEYTSHHLHRYKVHLPTFLQINLASVCLSKSEDQCTLLQSSTILTVFQECVCVYIWEYIYIYIFVCLCVYFIGAEG